jgi:phosphocarrier protein HPr
MSLAQETRQVEVVNEYGLHARPAMQLVELANQFASSVEVANGPVKVDAKSIMSVMRLAATCGTQLTIMADGEDAAQACEALVALIADGFGPLEKESSSGTN